MRAKIITLLGLLFFILPTIAQEAVWDSLGIQYRLIYTNYNRYEDIYKIKVPPYLSTHEVMRQIKLAVRWPGDPPPMKRITVYVFREDAGEGEVSSTGGKYFPGKGFKWDLGEWEPDSSIFHYHPSQLDQVIYNTLLDSFFAAGIVSPELESKQNSTKKNVAKWFYLTVPELDSIYYHVKWWLDLKKDHLMRQQARNKEFPW